MNKKEVEVLGQSALALADEVKRLKRQAEVFELIAGRVITSLHSFDKDLAAYYDGVLDRAKQETS